MQRLVKLVIASLSVMIVLTPWTASAADPLPLVRNVQLQPLRAQVRRVVMALDKMLGAPLSEKQHSQLKLAMQEKDAAKAVAAIQKTLDPLCLVDVNVNAESRVKVTHGPAAARLMQHGWRVFLVKVRNQAGVTAALRCLSPNAPLPKRSSNRPEPKTPKNSDTRDRWLAIEMFSKQPLNKNFPA